MNARTTSPARRSASDGTSGAASAVVGFVAVFVVGALSSCRPAPHAPSPPPPAEVTVAHPVRRAVMRRLESTGVTEAFQTVDLRARVPGFLERVEFKPGAKVAVGDLLFVIDRRTYAAVVERAAARLAASRAAYAAADSDAKIAEELAAKRAGSEIDKITKTARRESARAAIEAAAAELRSAELDLEFCEVRAPIEGRITKNLADVGNLVGAAGVPTTLATLVSAKPVYVTADVSERDFLDVRRSRLAKDRALEPGQVASGEWRRVSLALADEAEFRFHGRIDYVDPALNPETGTIRVRCRFENEDEFLPPGLFVRLRFEMETVEAVLAPDAALQADQGGRYALVLDDRDVVQQRRIKIGGVDGPDRVVVEGLATEDRVIVNGLQRARVGATVRPTPRASSSGDLGAASRRGK